MSQPNVNFYIKSILDEIDHKLSNEHLNDSNDYIEAQRIVRQELSKYYDQIKINTLTPKS